MVFETSAGTNIPRPEVPEVSSGRSLLLNSEEAKWLVCRFLTRPCEAWSVNLGNETCAETHGQEFMAERLKVRFKADGLYAYSFNENRPLIVRMEWNGTRHTRDSRRISRSITDCPLRLQLTGSVPLALSCFTREQQELRPEAGGRQGRLVGQPWQRSFINSRLPTEWQITSRESYFPRSSPSTPCRMSVTTG